MGQINKEAVLEHIAKVTGKELSEIGRAVDVEYWKDMVNFGSLKGLPVFVSYLKNQGIKGVAGSDDKYFIKVPISSFQEANPRDTCEFCIEGTYGGLFRYLHKKEFRFVG